MTIDNHTRTTLPSFGWEVREQDWRGWIEYQLGLAAGRRKPPVKTTRFTAEADARAHAAQARARNPHPDYLIAVVQIGRKIVAQPT
jgi:hypothetical protein